MLWISSFAAGLCLALVARVVLGPWARRVPACPWLLSPGSPLRLIWLWVCCLAPALEPMLSWRYRARLETLLRTAGLDRHWLPVHVLACQVLAGWVLLAPSAIFVFLLGLSPASGLVVLVFVFTGASLGVAGQFKRLGQLRQAAMLRELPFMLDMTTLCVRAGLNLQGALEAPTGGFDFVPQSNLVGSTLAISTVGGQLYTDSFVSNGTSWTFVTWFGGFVNGNLTRE